MLRISSTEDGKRFYGRPSFEAQRPGATLFVCEENGPHDIHHQIEELEDGTCIDIYWADKNQSRLKGVPNPLLVGKPQMGKWLQHKARPAKIKQAPVERKPIKAEDW